VVVLTGDEDEAIELCDLRGPGLGVLVRVLAVSGGHRLIEEGQFVVSNVDELVLGVAALDCAIKHPLGQAKVNAAGAGGTGDDGDLGHTTPAICLVGCPEESEVPKNGNVAHESER